MKIYVAITEEGEARLVELRSGAVVDRVSGEVLDPARIELRVVDRARARRVRRAA